MATTNSTNSEPRESSTRLLWPLWIVVAVVVIGIGLRTFIPPYSQHGVNQMNTDEQRLIDSYLSRIEVARGNKFTAEQRDRIYEVAQMDLMKKALGGIPEKPPNEQEKLLEGIVRLALVRSGETLPAPSEITAQVLADTPDAELPQMLYDFVCTRFSATGAYYGGDDSFRHALLGLPRGLRAVFTTYSLDGEISNGGVGQLFTNSSGTYLHEMLEDCRLIGATKRAAALKKAMNKWQPTERIFKADERDLDEWTGQYYELEKSEPLDSLITKFLRAHPDDCLTSPGTK